MFVKYRGATLADETLLLDQRANPLIDIWVNPHADTRVLYQEIDFVKS